MSQGNENPADDHAILRERARKLARPQEDQAAAGPTVPVVEFRIATERYAVEQVYVREVIPFRDLAPLPCVPAFLLGLVNVRGQILPVIDIRKFFDLPESGITDLHVVIAIKVDDTEIGILADAMGEGRVIPVSAIQPPLPTLTGIRSEYLRGVTVDHVALLDAVRIVNSPRILINEDVQLV